MSKSPSHPNLRWSWRKRAVVFFSLFGGIWLFTEPLYAFSGQDGLLSSLGLWRYAILMVCSMLLTFLNEAIHGLTEGERQLDELRRQLDQQGCAAAHLSGIMSFHSKRSHFDKAWWEQFFSEEKTPEEVVLMGQSISRAFSNPVQANAFVKWCNNRARIRILYLSPSNMELAQLQDVGQGMLSGSSGNPSENLKTKIENSVADLEEHVISKVRQVDRKPMVRFATRNLPFSLMAVGDDMVVTLYGTEAEGDAQPTIRISGGKSEAYQSFMQEFERIWSDHSKISQFEDPIIADYRQDWQQYISLRDYSAKLPPPRQAIIFPTYRCGQKCSYCMFRDARIKGVSTDMALASLEEAMESLMRSGVTRFEVSGGGEPLEHPEAKGIISCLTNLCSPDIKLGLLTNGAHLGEHCPLALLRAFNDYIRVSRYEQIEQTDNELGWKKNLQDLLESKRSDPDIQTKIGLKYLLTPKNQDYFVGMVESDLGDRTLRNADHFRFRSTREVAQDTIAEVEQRISYIVQSAGLPNPSEKVSLSLSNFAYPRNFRCWISPMNVVIAPDGEVYACCNYLHDQNSKCLGNIKKGFETLWQSAQHRELRGKLRRANCASAKYCNCRYAEIQGVLERIALTAGV